MRILFVSPGFSSRTIRQQPWHFVYHVARGLSALGHSVTVVSDGWPTLSEREEIEGVQVRHLASVRCPPLKGNPALTRLLLGAAPDVIVWNIGMASLLHLRVPAVGSVNVGLLTSPYYGLGQLLRLGLAEWRADPRGLATHLLHTLAPRPLLRARLRAQEFCAFVVHSQRTREALLSIGAGPEHVHVVWPGVENLWLDRLALPEETRRERRTSLGARDGDFLVLYLGSPATMRGPDTLVKAMALAARERPGLRLGMLLRCHDGEFARELRALEGLVHAHGLEDRVALVPGFLAQEEVRQFVEVADAVALPFKLVPSEAPISVLEALAAAKPVVSCPVSAISELAARADMVLARPGDVADLARALLCVADENRAAATKGALPVEGWGEVTQEFVRVIGESVGVHAPAG